MSELKSLIKGRDQVYLFEKNKIRNVCNMHEYNHMKQTCITYVILKKVSKLYCLVRKISLV